MTENIKQITKSDDFLGKKVPVHIDRQLGTKHPKYDWKYPINYGFVPDTMSPDGEELDVYLLGVAEPVEDFAGTCVAILRRSDDNDDKLIVVPEGTAAPTDDEIYEATYFQEQWFKSTIIR